MRLNNLPKIFKNQTANILSWMFIITSVISGVASFGIHSLDIDSNPLTIAEAASEPNCTNRTVGTTPTFNAFPIQTQFPNPTFIGGICQDTPTLSFFADQPANRGQTLQANQSTSVQLYYSNSAAPGSNPITNPNASVAVTKTDNTYNLKATLSGNNATTMQTVTGGSAVQDGDLNITVQPGYRLEFIQQASWFPQAVIRKEIADGIPFWTDTNGQRQTLNPSAGRQPNDPIAASNLFSSFDGLPGFSAGNGVNLSYKDTPNQLSNNLPSNLSLLPTGITAQTLYPDGVRDTDTPNTLPAGFLDYGYILFTVRAVRDENAGTSLVIQKNLQQTNGGAVIPDGEVLTRGQTYQYRLQFRNNGNARATGVVINDQLPNQFVEYVANSCNVPTGYTCSVNSAGLVTINLDSFAILQPSTEFVTATFNVRVRDNAPSGEILNQGAIDSEQTEVVLSNRTRHILQDAPTTLSIVKSANPVNGSTVTAGQTIAYNLRVTNTGQSTANNLVVTDVLDQKVTYTTNSCRVSTGVANCNYNSTTRTLTWNISQLAVGASIDVGFDTTVNTGLTNGAVILNTGRVIASNAGEVVSNETRHIIQVLTPANLEIIKSIENNLQTVQVGNTYTYTLQFRNTGQTAATQVVIRDTLDTDVTYQNNSCSVIGLPTGATCSHSGGVITWSGFDLPADMTNYLSVTYRVTINDNASGSIYNIARITSPQDPDGAEDDVTVNVDTTRAILQINKTIVGDPASVQPNQVVTYRLQFRNVGNRPASATVIRDILDPDVTYINATCTLPAQISGANCAHSNGVITWNLGTLPANMSQFYEVTYQVRVNSNAAGNIDNVAVITSPDDPTGDQDEETVPVLIQNAALQINKQVVGSNNVTQGQELIYNLRIRNVGNGVARTVTVNDFLDSDTTYINNSCTVTSLPTGATCNHSNGTITWSGFDLPADMTDFLTIQYRVRVNDNAQGAIRNIARITSPDDPSGDEDEEVVFVNVTGANIQINKQVVGSNNVTQGQELIYNLRIRNVGNGVARTVTVNDFLDSDTTYINNSCTVTSLPTGATCNHSNGTITWSGFDLPADMTDFLTIQYRVRVNDNAQGAIRNIARITSPDDPSGDEDEEVVTVVNNTPRLQINKAIQGNPSSVAAGENVTYTLDIRNIGNAVATGVTVVDNLDGDTTYVNNSCTVTGLPTGATCSHSNGTITWSGFDLPANMATTIRVQYQVDVNTNAAGIIRNVVNIRAINEPVGDNDEESVPVVSQNVILQIQKNADQTTATRGEEIVYTLRFRNAGTSNATNVTIRDVLDTDVSFIDGSCTLPSPALTGSTCNHNAGILTWNIPTLAPSATFNTVTYRVRVSDTATGNIDNVVRITSPQDPEGDQDEVRIPVVVTPPPADPANLEIIKETVNNVTQVAPNDTITYRLRVRNTGGIPATQTVIRDTLDTDTTYIDNTCTLPTQLTGANCSHTSGIITWNLGTLPANMTEYYTVTYQVRVNTTATGTIRNVAVVTSPEDPTGDEDEEIITVVPPADPANLEIIKETVNNVTQVAPNDTITYRLRVRNTGGAPATQTVIRDTLDTDTTYIDNTCTLPTQLTGANCSHTSGIITWNLGTLPANMTEYYTVTYQVRVNSTATGTIRNVAVVTSPEDPTGDEDIEEIPVVVTPPITPPAISIVKSVNPASGTTVVPTQQLTYSLAVRNTGGQTANNVVIRDTLDNNLEFVSCDNNCTQSVVNNQTVLTWTISTLAVNQTINLSFVARVRPTATGTIRNLATVVCPDNSTTCCPSGNCNSNEVVNPINPGNLTIDKQVQDSDGVVVPGQVVGYIINFSNATQVVQTNVRIVDTLPAQVTYVDGSCSNNCTFNSTARTLTWNVGTLNPAQSGQVSYQVRVNDDASGNLRNIAVITADQTGPREDETNNNVRRPTLIDTPRTGGEAWMAIAGFSSLVASAGGVWFYGNKSKFKKGFGGGRISGM
jgi:uncharacterized repeat protein (TIGR01451 family)